MSVCKGLTKAQTYITMIFQLQTLTAREDLNNKQKIPYLDQIGSTRDDNYQSFSSLMCTLPFLLFLVLVFSHRH